MIRYTKKIIAGFLMGVLILTSMLPSGVFAADSTASEESSVGENAQQSDAINDYESNNKSESDTANQPQNQINKDQDTEVNEAASLLQYLYVESPYLEAPAKQNLVLSWGNGTESVDKVELLYKHNGQEGSFGLENKGEGLYLYQKDFFEEEAGIYVLTDVRITESGQEMIYSLTDMGINACFGVNEYYPGYKPEESLVPVAQEDNVAVITEKEIESSEATEILGEALEAAGAEPESGVQISTYALNNSRTSNGKIVVALDAGHDSRHAGANGNGVFEETATLKIAQYCKEELEKYSGVKVYMCRTSAACPYPGTSATGDIRERVRASARQGADVYVSIHLNSSTASSANGAEVWYPDGSQTPNTVGPGKELAEKIQNELVSIGLGNRGAKETDDNFACMDEGAKYNLPAVIVEHAFLTNGNDANNYLKSEAGLKKLGIADAAGIVKYFGLNKGDWVTDSNGNKYYYQDGEKVYGEKCINNEWYHFDESTGSMTTGWYELSGRKLYYKATGEMAHGELCINDEWYNFSTYDGDMITGWYDFGDRLVYYRPTGEMVHGELCINGEWYNFSTYDGRRITGWYNFGDRLVYYRPTGEMVHGELCINGEWYNFSMYDGRRITGWYNFGDRLVYYRPTGEMVHGELCINGEWYNFSTYDGRRITGWYNFGDRLVYYRPTGEMVHGELCINGEWYNFSTYDGDMITGWYDFVHKRVYYKTNGEMVHGEYKIGNKWYYFSTYDGALQKNMWYNSYYYGDNGVRVENNSKLYKIEGTSSVNVEQMVDFYNKNSLIQYPSEELAKGGAPTIETFARIYKEEADAEGIKCEVAWAQAMLETGYLKFGGSVSITQFNFAGIGAIDGGTKGADFSVYGIDGVRMGIRAQIQHLKAYASDKALNQICVDPRFTLVTRKCAEYVEYLGQQENPDGKGWATSEGYGYKIIDLINRLKTC